MFKKSTLTDEQKAAAKPWAIGVLLSMWMGITSIALLCVYLDEISPWISSLWFCGTLIAIDLGVHLCNKNVAQIINEDPPRLAQHWLQWTLIAGFCLYRIF